MKMKKNKNFDKFLHQYIDVENSKKQKYVNVFYQIYNESDTANVSLDEDFKQKLKAIPSDNKKQINFLPILRYAAIVALVLVVSILASIGFLDKKINNNEFLTLAPRYEYEKLIETYQNPSDNHSTLNTTQTAHSSTTIEHTNNHNTPNINYLAESNIAPLEMKKSIIPLQQQDLEYSAELVDTRTIYQGLQNIAAIMEQEEITQANINYKNQIIINTWNNIKNFIGEGEVPGNISLASAYNFIRNTANKQKYRLIQSCFLIVKTRRGGDWVTRRRGDEETR